MTPFPRSLRDDMEALWRTSTDELPFSVVVTREEFADHLWGLICRLADCLPTCSGPCKGCALVDRYVEVVNQLRRERKG